MPQFLPDQIKALWAPQATHGLSSEQVIAEETRLMDQCRSIWTEALRTQGQPNLTRSLLSEISAYTGCEYEEVERRCLGAVGAVKDEWYECVKDTVEKDAVQTFYDQSEAYIYDLMWWHTLANDTTPLAYVVAMQFSMDHGGTRYLDFGAGVGSAGILFARHEFDVTLADISSKLLRFADYRLKDRGLSAALIDLKSQSLPAEAFDMVTAMDVWEHLTDPVATVDQLADAIAPGGILFGRFAAEVDENYPQHIVTEFEPTFRRLAERGFTEVWHDDWLWGHQAFEKR